MHSTPRLDKAEQNKSTRMVVWAQRLIISLTFLAWLILIIVVARIISYIATTLLILIVAALIAYAVVPLVGFFQKIMPRALAILLTYLVVLGCIVLLLYLLIITSVAQVAALASTLRSYFMPGRHGLQSPIVQILQRFGVTQAQIGDFSKALSDQLTNIAEDLARGVVPLVTGVAGALVNVLLTTVISIYLLVDGERAINWVRKNAPHPLRSGTRTLLEILQRVVGGYIRGQFILCIVVGFLVGIGMFALRVPYAVLLGAMGGFMEFVPVLGTLASGIACCLLALTQGWLTFILVLIYFIILHAFEGYVLSPRIVGKAVGLHPAVSLLALATGGELFGPFGAILSVPAAGLIQNILIALWIYYREGHREQFPREEQDG